MILLTRINNTEFWLNPDLVIMIESKPDTTITLVNGEKQVVLESPQQVCERIIAYRQAIAVLPKTIPANPSV
ncbi:MAG: flagellar FlbD family protein [Vampirovibrionales bacterium]|nr:flagellar FlbD family protein [Vampirovibrionales bacterium]